jgi:glycosyltransferase involved in cell wall biosynthesis
MERIDLLAFTENYSQGGGVRFMIDLINASPKQFLKFHILSNKGGISHQDYCRLNRSANLENILLLTAAYFNNNSKKYSRTLFVFLHFVIYFFDFLILITNIFLYLNYLRKKKPRLLLVCNGGYPGSRACIAMVIAAKLLKIDVILSIVSTPAKRKFFVSFYEKIIDKLVWTSVSKVIVNANFISSKLSSLRGMPRNKATVAHNFLDDFEPPDSFNYKAIRKKNFHIGFIGRLDKNKGVTLLLDAFILLLKKYPNLTLTLVGSGNLEKCITEKVKFLSLQKKIILPGHFKGDITQLLFSFDIFVFPSLWEGFPYSILEAMRSRLPIVSTNVGGIPEAITNMREGLLVNPDSSEELAYAIEELINNSNLRFKLAKNAQIKFRNSFSGYDFKSKVISIFKDFS